VIPLPDKITFAQAATFPVAGLTTLYDGEGEVMFRRP